MSFEVMEYPQEFLDMIQVGKSVKINYGKKNPNTRRIHIVGIFDDVHVACKSWSKKSWHYEFIDLYYLLLCWNDGLLKR